MSSTILLLLLSELIITSAKPRVKTGIKSFWEKHTFQVEESNFDEPKRKEGISDKGKREEGLEKNRVVNYEKSDRSKELIKQAILANQFLNNLMDDEKIKLVIDAVYLEEYAEGSYIITEGEPGSHLYVSEEGNFEVIKNGVVVKKFKEGEAFGELALLFSAKRLASVKAVSAVKVWVLDRRVFQDNIIVPTELQKQKDIIKFLRSVPFLENAHQTIINRISDLLKTEFFSGDSVIVKQGDPGDKFYIIRVGSVIVSKRSEIDNKDQKIAVLTRGQFFGELALLQESVRQASITAQPPAVECLTLDRESFLKYIGGLTNPDRPDLATSHINEYSHVQLKDLSVVGTLGEGGFGRVELVQYKNDPKVTFALKYLKKVHVVEQQQEEHAYNEKNVMFSCNSRFITKLYKTFKDDRYLYFLMEPCLGGDLITILAKKGKFDEKTTRFIVACVIEALEHLHERDIVYRDLKPENLMLDSMGYIKLVDFGFAKKLGPTGKTWTFAGTPEYVAPEIIFNRGHNKAVDFWALGILIHELFSGKPPFRCPDGNHMRTFDLITKGLESVQLSPLVPASATDLLRRLCRKRPVERLGCQKDGIMDIKKHPWFHNFKWEKLRSGRLKAPLVRPVKSSTDLENFPRYKPDRSKPPADTSGWDEDF